MEGDARFERERETEEYRLRKAESHADDCDFEDLTPFERHMDRVRYGWFEWPAR